MTTKTKLDPLCEVCGQRIKIAKSLLAEHKNKSGVLCYGSFRPATNINPFVTKKKPAVQNFIGGGGFPDLDMYGEVVNNNYHIPDVEVGHD